MTVPESYNSAMQVPAWAMLYLIKQTYAEDIYDISMKAKKLEKQLLSLKMESDNNMYVASSKENTYCCLNNFLNLSHCIEGTLHTALHN